MRSCTSPGRARYSVLAADNMHPPAKSRCSTESNHRLHSFCNRFKGDRSVMAGRTTFESKISIAASNVLSWSDSLSPKRIVILPLPMSRSVAKPPMVSPSSPFLEATSIARLSTFARAFSPRRRRPSVSARSRSDWFSLVLGIIHRDRNQSARIAQNPHHLPGPPPST